MARAKAHKRMPSVFIRTMAIQQQQHLLYPGVFDPVYVCILFVVFLLFLILCMFFPIMLVYFGTVSL